MFCKHSVLIMALLAAVVTGCSGPRLGSLSSRYLNQTPTRRREKLPDPPDKGWTSGLEVKQEEDFGKEQRWLPVYFAYDQSTIGDSERPKLEKIYGFLQENGKYHLLIEGHCDQRGSEEYNRALGERRALAVRNYLVDRGLTAERLHTLSFGEEKPAKEGKSEEAFRLNRRAELIVLPPKAAAALK